jgi:hypothetical protein
MSKGTVLDEPFLNEVGLSEQLLTLKGPVQNKHHPDTQEPMFVINVKEIEEPLYLERNYVFTNQVTIKTSLGLDDKVLIWQARSLRPRAGSTSGPLVPVLMAREFFLLGEWREFGRFKTFVKSQRILDAQARQWLADHHQDLPKLAGAAPLVEKVVDVLGHIAEWPDLEAHIIQGPKLNALELVAKTYSAGLAAFRASPHLCEAMIKRSPDIRFNIFRLLGYVEDPMHGSKALVTFLNTLAGELRDSESIALCGRISGARDLAKAFVLLRHALFAHRS